MNSWSKELGVEYPECKCTGQCCRCASPSSASTKLLEKAANGNGFARDFFSIFTPYLSVEDARKINPGSVDRSLNACKSPTSEVKPDEVVFYYCKYISDENKCLIYEDRPQLCRDYPDSPFLVFPPNCAYEGWSRECREKYKGLKEELENLKQQKRELENLKYQQKVMQSLRFIHKFDKEHKFMALFPDLCLISPAKSWLTFENKYKQIPVRADCI